MHFSQEVTRGRLKAKKQSRAYRACTAADTGCPPFLTQNALLNPKGKKRRSANTGEIPFTVDKALSHLRASLPPPVWI